MKIKLNVPSTEGHLAKRSGASWDRVTKTWFVENKENLAPFLRWMPPHLTKPHRRSA